MLRDNGLETEALDVLDRATELGMRAAPDDAHAQELTVDLAVKPRGPYSLALSARLSSDATRTFRDGLFTAVTRRRRTTELVRAWQSPDGTVAIRAASPHRRARGCDGFSRSTTTTRTSSAAFGTTRCSAAASRALRGLAARAGRNRRACAAARVLRPADRGEAGATPRADDHPDALRRRRRELAPLADARASSPRSRPTQLRALGLHAKRAASLVRICRAIELERLHDVADRRRGRAPRARARPRAVVGRVVCLEGLGRYDYGLVGDLGLVKLLRALRGRPVEGWETAELLEPYGEWAGLASVYLLAGYSRGLVPLAEPRAA